MKRARGGFTLIELLTAMSLFLTLGIVLFGLLRQGLGLYHQGESRRTSYERGLALLDEIATDLRAARGGIGLLTPDPDILFLVDHDSDGRQRLRFVRSIPREMADEDLRLAGSMPGGDKDFEFGEFRARSSDPKKAPAWRALRGLAEVAWVCRPAGEGSDPDRRSMTLERAMKAPPGGDSSLMKNENLTPERTHALASGVLYFGVDLMADAGTDEPELLDEWDSSRARLKTFRWHVGPDSLADPRDDLFPRAVRLTVTIEREDAGAAAPKVDATVNAKDRRIPVSTTEDLPGPTDPFPFVKIGDEWVRVAGTDRSGSTLTAAERGARDTTAAPHERGARVHTGQTLIRWVELPCHREAVR
ncbi:MAG: prepilin-type N-terminal cleavage/methylation domain-containing protein [Planctomycetes bacterium]|nr:prepilin-type N-terminal cleavage/methylation domain-containing protein [Planctomycetota bacterium]MBI3846795.1 prepilin-type N-terminal cleavage/methylation domain-containing protein [Planctomycetota bacterium]